MAGDSSPENRELCLQHREEVVSQVADSAPALPERGKSWEEIHSLLLERKRGEVSRDHGHLTMWCIWGGRDIKEITHKAWSEFFDYNALFLVGMPGVESMEVEVTQWACGLFGGGPEARGFFTTGGTESIYSGILSARDWAREEKPQITQPNMVIPASAHPAFNKAAGILGLREVRVPLRPDKRTDVLAMEEAITPDTVMLAGSFPCWPYGRYDDIENMASLAESKGLWFHVDACLGGWMAPFVKELGREVPPFDLSVPGVCSLSADIHKYGYAPKPASVVLYRTRELAKYQLFCFDNWASGLYPTWTFAGSRPGGAVAGAWAAINYLGRQGYLERAKRYLEVWGKLAEGVNAIEGLRVWESDLANLFYEGVGIDITAVISGLQEKGYYVLGTQDPDLPLICLTVDSYVEDEWIDLYLHDVAEVTGRVRAGELTAGASGRYV